MNDKTWKEIVQDFLNNDLKDFVRTSRKAVIAGLGAFAASIGAAIPAIFADGVVTYGELVPSIVISVGAGLAIGFATYQVPNDERGA